MAISPYRFFSIYQGVHLHFTTSYDIFKYAGKAKTITVEAFQNRKDHQRFVYWAEKIQSQEDALQLCVFNSLKSSSWFYGSYEQAKDVLLEKRLFYSMFTKNMMQDYNTIQQLKKDKGVSLDTLIKPTASGNKPPILQLYFQGGVSLEFLCLLNNEYNMVDYWMDSLDPLVKTESERICKYTKFTVLFSKKVRSE